MTAYNYNLIRYEAQQHFDRLAHEAATERLAQQVHGETASKRAAGRRWLDLLHAGWATRLIHHSSANASMAARVS